MTIACRVLIALVVWGVLSFGAVYPWAYWPLAAGAFALGAWAISATHAWREPRPRAVGLALAGIATALVIQIVPVPYSWFRSVTPAADRLLAQLELGWSAQPPAWHSLSIAPDSTLTSLLLLIAFGVLLVGLTRAVSYMDLSWVVGQLTMFGVVLALFGIAQRLVSGPSDLLVYGFWRPGGYATPFGPFINRNHFAGWMVLMLPLVVASACASLEPTRASSTWRSRFEWLMMPDAGRFVFSATASFIMATALVMTGSRSGMASLVVAVGMLVWLTARRLGDSSRRWLAPAGFVAVMIIAIGWVGVAQTAARFDRAAEELSERAAAWQDTKTIIRDFPITGTGVGGYGTAMLVYQTAARHSIYVQAHNDYLQLIAEGGVLLAIPVAIAVVVIMRSIRHRFRGHDDAATSWLRAGAVAGLAGIATQSLVDFSLQMPGNVMMFVFLLAVALHRPSGSRGMRRSAD